MKTKVCQNCGATDVPERNVLCTSCGKIADKKGGEVKISKPKDSKPVIKKKGKK